MSAFLDLIGYPPKGASPELERMIERASYSEPRIAGFEPARLPGRVIDRLTKWNLQSSSAFQPLAAQARDLGTGWAHLNLRGRPAYWLPIDFDPPVSTRRDALDIVVGRVVAGRDAARPTPDDDALAPDVLGDVRRLSPLLTHYRRLSFDRSSGAAVELFIEEAGRPNVGSCQGLLRELAALRESVDFPDELVLCEPGDPPLHEWLEQGGWLDTWTWLTAFRLATAAVEHQLIVSHFE